MASSGQMMLALKIEATFCELKKVIQNRHSLVSRTASRAVSTSPALSKPAAKSAPETPPTEESSPLPFSSIPGPTGVAQWPVIGAAMLFKPFTKFTPGTAHQMFESLFQKYGSIVRLQLRGSTVIVRDIKDVETVFRNEGIYPKRPSLQLPKQFAKRNGFKDGFNEVQGKQWHKLRAPLSRRLARVNSATYYMQDQNIVANEFRTILETGGHLTPEEMSDIFFRFAAESRFCKNDNTHFNSNAIYRIYLLQNPY
ncbi:cytochrome P450 10 [Elysia marginata]|uniref:Cytochrome P450 10 n=1 Tax=Elysia marginata TaxID=1093978 RepID=A0AAV4GD76_9GAST|nr:cytochrome P450 10 [Elysia marginata]